MNAKNQLNVRLSDHGRGLLDALVAHFTAASARETGRKTTQAEVVERAVRLLAAREKIPKKVPRKAPIPLDNV